MKDFQDTNLGKWNRWLVKHVCGKVCNGNTDNEIPCQVFTVLRLYGLYRQNSDSKL